jgi:hypothetical protein
VPSSNTRATASCAGLERLEERRLLSGTTGAFAILSVGSSTPKSSGAIVNVGPDDFAIPRSGILLGLASQSAGSGAPGDVRMKMVPMEPAHEDVVLRNDHPVAGGTSLMVARVGSGRFGLSMTGARGGSAPTQVAVTLIGDVNGDGRVTRQDLVAIRESLGLRAGSPGYSLAADVNRDGVITRADLRWARRNLGAGTSVRPLSVSASLAGGTNQDVNRVVTTSRFEIAGRTAPGARVFALAGGAPVATAVAGPRGVYRLHLSMGIGKIDVRVLSSDTFGQRATALATVTRGDVVIAWNSVALAAARAAQTPVGLFTRNTAMVSAAVYDAVNDIERTGAVDRVDALARPGASPIAAASQAAYSVLVALYPSQRARFDATLAQTLGTIPHGPSKHRGREVGIAVAQGILAWRANDGSSAMMTYTPGTAPGKWQPTPPDYSPGVEPMWGQVTPFGVPSAMQFLPPPPPPLDSPAYTAAFDEVKSLGAVDSTTRTPEETQIALFWAYDVPGIGPPPIFYNQILETIAVGQHNTLTQNARLFALADVAMADAAIVAWDTKYIDEFWRPVTAIRAADTDGNPDTVADPSWTPLGSPGHGIVPNFTPAFPAYISGHATFGAALFQTLADFYHTDHVTFTLSSDELPGVTRTFTSFSAASEENGQSRIYLGIHWQFDKTEGIATGDSIANYVFTHILAK